MRLGRPGAQFPGKIIAKEFAKAQHGKAATKTGPEANRASAARQSRNQTTDRRFLPRIKPENTDKTGEKFVVTFHL
jgi:hypothetical protein